MLSSHQRCGTLVAKTGCQPQRGVTLHREFELRPVGAETRLGRQAQAVGLGYRVSHRWC